MKNKNAHTSRFDIAICNPPYCRDLHLRILDEVVLHCDEVVNISPIRWLKDPLFKHKRSSIYNKFKTIMCSIDEIDCLDAKLCTEKFEAAFMVGLGIIKFRKGTEQKVDVIKRYSNTIIDKVMLHKKNIGVPTKQYAECKDKIFTLIKGVDSTQIERGKLSTDLSIVRGKFYGDYYVNGISNNGKTVEQCKEENKLSVHGKVDEWKCVVFETVDEVKNFVNSTRTKFMRYVYYAGFINGSVFSVNLFPFMNDYTQPWTDERFYKYYDLTKDEIDKIEETIRELSIKYKHISFENKVV